MSVGNHKLLKMKRMEIMYACWALHHKCLERSYTKRLIRQRGYIGPRGIIIQNSWWRCRKDVRSYKWDHIRTRHRLPSIIQSYLSWIIGVYMLKVNHFMILFESIHISILHIILLYTGSFNLNYSSIPKVLKINWFW